MKHAYWLAAVAAFGLAGGAVAHTDAVLATQAAPNGGQMRAAGPYHFELVLAPDSSELKEHPVLVFVTDHDGGKIVTAGATGTATLLAGKEKVLTKLTPDGDNRLRGVARFAAVTDLKVVVSIVLSGKNAEQARFTPLAVGRAGGAKGKP